MLARKFLRLETSPRACPSPPVRRPLILARTSAIRRLPATEHIRACLRIPLIMSVRFQRNLIFIRAQTPIRTASLNRAALSLQISLSHYHQIARRLYEACRSLIPPYCPLKRQTPVVSPHSYTPA